MEVTALPLEVASPSNTNKIHSINRDILVLVDLIDDDELHNHTTSFQLFTLFHCYIKFISLLRVVSAEPTFPNVKVFYEKLSLWR